MGLSPPWPVMPSSPLLEPLLRPYFAVYPLSRPNTDTLHCTLAAPCYFFNFFYYTSNQNAILSAHTKNEIFRIKIEKVKNLFYPKSFNSPYPGGLRVEIFFTRKIPIRKNK